MIYPSSVLCTPFEVIKEFNSLVFRFLWNGNDNVIRLSTYAPYDQGGLKMLEYKSMVKALRLSWLKRIVDPDYFGFWKSYLDHLLVYEMGLFLRCLSTVFSGPYQTFSFGRLANFPDSHRCEIYTRYWNWIEV